MAIVAITKTKKNPNAKIVRTVKVTRATPTDVANAQVPTTGRIYPTKQ